MKELCKRFHIPNSRGIPHISGMYEVQQYARLFCSFSPEII